MTEAHRLEAGLVQRLRSGAWAARGRWDRFGLSQPESRKARDAAAYWADPSSPNWQSNSHWRGGLTDEWDVVGRESLDISERLVRVTGSGLPTRRTVEWGCGGGANAVYFAPRCEEFVAVDVVGTSLEECERQVRKACSTPVRKVLVDLPVPEAAVERIGRGSCDLFVSFYVFELVPSKEYGARLLSVVRDLLTPGGVAVIQIKYATIEAMTRSRRRAYRRDPAAMTTYPIDEFWTTGSEHGLTPHALTIVPFNALDERYAYFVFTKDDERGPTSTG